MNMRDSGLAVGTDGVAVEARIAAIDWSQANAELDAQGAGVIPGLLPPQACAELAALYPRDELFRSRVVMARHGFGRGESRYFGYPLPPLVERRAQRAITLPLPEAFG
jgi:hypothetical protein